MGLFTPAPISKYNISVYTKAKKVSEDRISGDQLCLPAPY